MKNELLQLIWGYRLIKVLNRIVTAKLDDIDEEDMKEVMRALNRYPIQVDEEELFILIENLRHTIKYAYYDMAKIWSQEKPLVHSQAMPKEVLEDYKLSMTELHNLTQFDFDLLIPYIENRKVLDFGCGNRFFTRYFLDLNPLSLFGVDRLRILGQEDLQLMNENGKVAFVLTTEKFEQWFADNGEKFDTIWLSEVVHGKNELRGFMTYISYFLADGGHIIISDLIKGSPRDVCFNEQMQIHCQGGGLDFKEKLKKYSEFVIVEENLIFSEYHELTILKKKSNG